MKIFEFVHYLIWKFISYLLKLFGVQDSALRKNSHPNLAELHFLYTYFCQQVPQAKAHFWLKCRSIFLSSTSILSRKPKAYQRGDFQPVEGHPANCPKSFRTGQPLSQCLSTKSQSRCLNACPWSKLHLLNINFLVWDGILIKMGGNVYI